MQPSILHFAFRFAIENSWIISHLSMYFAFFHYIFFYYKILELITDSLYETWFSPAKMILDSILIIYVSIIIKSFLFYFRYQTHRTSHTYQTKNHFRLRKFIFLFYSIGYIFVYCKWALHDFSFRFSIHFWESFNKPMTNLIRLVCFLSIIISNALEMNVISYQLFLFKNVWSCYCFVSHFSILFAVVNMHYAIRLFVVFFSFRFALKNLPIILRLGFIEVYMECGFWSHYLVNMWHHKHPAESRHELASVAYDFQH